MNYNLDENNVTTIETFLQETPVLLLPITTSEPLNDTLPVGAVSKISAIVTQAVAQKAQILCAPQIRYGFSTPFKAFPGVLSPRRNTFVTTVADVVRSAIGWGVTKVIFLEGSSYLRPSIDEALRRYKRKLPDGFSYSIISWQTLGVVRKFVKEHFENLNEQWRSEALFVYLWDELFGESVSSSTHKPVDQKLLTRWRKRGMDPDKFKAYCPKATLSRWDGYTTSDTLLPLLVTEIAQAIDKELQDGFQL